MGDLFPSPGDRLPCLGDRLSTLGRHTLSLGRQLFTLGGLHSFLGPSTLQFEPSHYSPVICQYSTARTKVVAKENTGKHKKTRRCPARFCIISIIEQLKKLVNNYSLGKRQLFIRQTSSFNIIIYCIFNFSLCHFRNLLTVCSHADHSILITKT